MSNEKELDLSGELEDSMKDYVPSENTAPDTFDLASVGRQTLEDLRFFKETRTRMIRERKELTIKIGILDKRIEIALNAIKTLQTPTE